MATFVLVHSPLVGPATWAAVGDELRRRGFEALVPSLTPPLEARSPWWRTAAEEVVTAARQAEAREVVLAGHSGAGPHLPAIERRVREEGVDVAACVFVDAGLPAPGRSPRDAAPEAVGDLIDRLGRGGRVPPWPEWWGADAMAALVPDPVVRAAVASECRPVPVALFDDPFPVVTGWPAAPCAVVSFTYEPEAADAERMGWVVARVPGNHLHMVVDPSGVADALQIALAAAGARP